jgi:hypothetical protein
VCTIKATYGNPFVPEETLELSKTITITVEWK